MSNDTLLDALALGCYACELAGYDIDGVSDQWVAEAQAEGSFELSFSVYGDLELVLNFDGKASRFEVAVKLLDGHEREALVYAALQLNREFGSGARRYSMDMFSGAIILSDEIALAGADPESLALLICDLTVMMADLAEHDSASSEQPSEAAAAIETRDLASFGGLVLRA